MSFEIASIEEELFRNASHVQAVLVDMEEGVVSEIMKGPLRDVFDHKQLITDVSGSGNNWSVHTGCTINMQFVFH